MSKRFTLVQRSGRGFSPGRHWYVVSVTAAGGNVVRAATAVEVSLWRRIKSQERLVRMWRHAYGRLVDLAHGRLADLAGKLRIQGRP